jgi:ribosomal protein S18 acetylase RimI-like enzyme
MSETPLVYRPFAGESDFPKMLAVIEGCKTVDGLERSDTLEDIARNYAKLHHSDPATDMVFAEVEGQVIGYGRCWWDIERTDPSDADSPATWLGFHVGYVLLEWRRRGIGSEILRRLQDRLSELVFHQIIAGKLSPKTPCLYSDWAGQTETSHIALIEKDGYQAIRHAFDMVRPDLENIPDIPLPPGLEVRPVLPAHYRAVWDASNVAFRDHWGYIPEPDEEFEKMQQSPLFDPSLWRVAWDGDQVAGMVLSFINKAENEEYGRKRGYTENICTLRPYRGKGLAKALIALSLRTLKERGMEHAALGVDAENISGALQLYKNMGYQVVKQSTIYRKKMSA